MVRPRWHAPVLALCVLALAVAGVLALWADELRAFIPAEKKAAPLDPPQQIPDDVL